jgi:predicted NAD-dependent protein-ADP-ribosyltransferase YbiA (DUF1768 family)
MVRSKLVPSINYIELKSLDPSDTQEHNYKAPLYEASVLGINTIISIGNIKNTYISENIVYYPIYLIKNDQVLSQIGVYEMFKADIPLILDDSGDINIEKAPAPLLYSFVKKSLIQQAVYIPPNPEAELGIKKSSKALGIKSKQISLKSLKSLESLESLESQVDKVAVPEFDKGRKDEDERDEALQAAIRASLEPVRLSVVPLKRKNIPVQNLEQSIAENKAYRPVKDEPWIQSYYHNNNFKIVRNQGGGDCLFMAICQAFLSIEPESDISVIKLRRMLAAVMTESQFSDYRERYEMFSKTLKELRDENTKLSADNQELAQRTAEPGISLTDKTSLKLQADTNKQRHHEIVNEIEMYKDYLKDVYFMRGIKNVEALRELVRKGEMTSEYWGDEWAIATLELILNVKFIVLSHRDYMAKDKLPYTQSNVIICGSNIDEKRYKEIDTLISADKKPGGIEAMRAMEVMGAREDTDARDKSKMKEFEVINPDYYIILSHTGLHYELVTYRDTAIFTFPEIPFCVKLQIANRCIESSAGNLESFSGTYQKIPQFILFYQHELGLEDIGKGDPGQGGGASANHVLTANPHFDPSIVLIYHSKSVDELPGHAQGDHVSNKNKSTFIPLIASGKGKNNWRKKISNEWCEPFTLDGHRWLSVEHYYQANKFLKRHPEFYLLFTMDANKKSKYYDEASILSRISQDVDLAKVAGKKIPKTIIDNKKVSLRPDGVDIDSEFFNGRNTRVLEDGTMAKFNQNDDLAKILLMTNNAKLINYVFSKQPTVSIHLMRVRSKLRTKKGGINVFETINDRD